MKHFFVINPHSFKKASARLSRLSLEINSCFSGKDKSEYKIYVSRYSRDAISAVHRYLLEAGGEPVRVYAIGGDGILFDCLNGVIDFPNVELTNIPYGSSNDFLRAFGEDAHAKFRDIESLINGTPHAIDIMHAGSNYAMNEINIGLIGQTIINSNTIFPKIPRALLKKYTGLAYTFCGMKALFDSDINKQQYTIIVDEEEEINGCLMNIHVANTACNGGTLTPSPYAKPNSGHLEAVIAKTSSKFKTAKAIGRYNKGKFEKFDFFIHRKCKTLEIKSDSILKMEMDGEGFLSNDVKLEILPAHINFFAPEGVTFVDFSHTAFTRREGANQT